MKQLQKTLHPDKFGAGTAREREHSSDQARPEPKSQD
jgi:hypothetical protein